jgi:hypothetical protein
MTERLQMLLIETAAAGALTFFSLSPQERALAAARALQLSAKASRRNAESCLRYALKSEGYAARMVAP